MARCIDDVAAWLDKHGLPEYIEKFHSAGYYSLQQCASLSKADLSVIGITKLGHVYRLLKDIERMKGNGELERSLLPPGSLSPSSNASPVDATSDKHKDIPSKLWNKPLHRLASFFTHTKSSMPPGMSSKKLPQKKESNEQSPKPIQRRWSLHKTITGGGRLFRWPSMRTVRDGTTLSGMLASSCHSISIVCCKPRCQVFIS